MQRYLSTRLVAIAASLRSRLGQKHYTQVDVTAKLANEITTQLQAIQAELQAIQAELRRLRLEGPIGKLMGVHDDQFVGVLSQRLIDMPLDNSARGQLYRIALNTVGILNYEDDVVSGERRFITRFLEQHPRAVIVDVGANAGQFTQMVWELCPAVTIHAFEPSPVSYAVLSAALHGTTVRAHQIALSDHAGQIELFDYSDEAGSQHASVYRGVIEAIHRRSASSTQVRCETLDAIAGQLGLEHINLLKIDAEGHELAVLAGAKELLGSNRIDVIQFEFNEMNVISRSFMKDFFAVLPSYRIYRLLRDGVIEFEHYDPTFMEVFAYQNIVCIRRDLDPFWIHPRS
jgi:FkbM family methyltransferase